MGAFEVTAVAIGSRFATEFAAAAPGVPVVQDNENTKDTVVTAPYVRFTILGGDSRLSGLGSPRGMRDFGIAIAQIFIELNTGDKKLLELADKVRTIFRSLSVVSGGVQVTFRQPSFTRVGPSGAYYQGNVDCPYQADFVETAA